MSKRLLWIITIVGLLVWINPKPGWAQDDGPADPVYVVQSGDTMWDIARRFGVPVEDLFQANPDVDASAIKPGDELVIPGLTGVAGRLETRALRLGETLTSLSRDLQVPADQLYRLNRVLVPSEMYIGRNVILPVRADDAEVGAGREARVLLQEGQTLLETAVLNDVNPWQLMLRNRFTSSGSITPGEILSNGMSPALPDGSTVGALPPEILDASIRETPLLQGNTALISLSAAADLDIRGSLAGNPLNFFYSAETEWAALQGIHAMLEPGLYPLELLVTLPGGEQWSFTQQVRVATGGYPFDPELIVDPATIDPEITQPENEQWNALAAPVTTEKFWDGLFASPVDPPFAECWPSTYGNRRSYNGSGYEYFHTGLDFCGAVGNAIYAPAAGEVIFQGALTVRGNATMINHGWGVYTAYMHQSEILVETGDRVTPGQLIGRVGGTGRVTGPHLHFEVWVGGIQVEPLEWLQGAFP